MRRTLLITSPEKFVADLQRIEPLHPDRRWRELEHFGSWKPVAEMYLTTHRDRRAQLLSRICEILRLRVVSGTDDRRTGSAEQTSTPSFISA
jgi:hypothetical protein